ncbi:MAG: hypothetical protein Q4D14_02620 [Bacteroidales bacterium]|nr:hypothetical protein [Bacteroidales bacterium]
MIDAILILGGHIQALGLARQVKAKGLHVSVVTNDRCAVARLSRSVDTTRFYQTDDELLSLLTTMGNKHTLLFPTSDDYIDFIVAHRQTLESAYTVALPDSKVVALFANKRNSDRFAVENDVPHPTTWCCDSLDDLDATISQVSFPCVLKPAVMYTFHKQFGKKAFLCGSAEVLKERVTTIVSQGFPIGLLMMQEFLSGGAKTLYSYGCFAVDGEPVVSIQANRIRQNPMDFGNSTTFAVTCHIDEIEQSARRILARTHYTGMAEIEFMHHNGAYKFLEINTRAWKWHTLSDGCGFSFVGAWIDYLNGKATSQPPYVEMAWVERLTDVAVVTKELLKGRIRLREVLHTYHRQKVSAVWQWRDPLPALMYVLLSPILYVKRH